MTAAADVDPVLYARRNARPRAGSAEEIQIREALEERKTSGPDSIWAEPILTDRVRHAIARAEYSTLAVQAWCRYHEIESVDLRNWHAWAQNEFEAVYEGVYPSIGAFAHRVAGEVLDEEELLTQADVEAEWTRDPTEAPFFAPASGGRFYVFSSAIDDPFGT